MTIRKANGELGVLHPEDLVVLERRGTISSASQRRLRMALNASVSLRVLQRLGQDFDQVPEQCLGDARLIEDLLLSARTLRAGVASPRRPAFAGKAFLMVGVAGLMLLSAAAGAALLPLAQRLVAQATVATSSDVARSGSGDERAGAAESKAHHAAVTPVASPIATDVLENNRFEIGQPERFQGQPGRLDGDGRPGPSFRGGTEGVEQVALAQEQERVSKRIVTDAAPSARGLFRDANRLRRQGDFALSESRYLQLQSMFPSSGEAIVSYVLLARLDLKRGAPTAALQRFDRYLEIAPSGALAEEALEGRATAFRNQGATLQEKESLELLLRRFPNSLYAAAARTRLSEMR